MAGILNVKQNKSAGKMLEPRPDDLLTRTMVVAADQALASPEMGPQLMQMVSAAQDPTDGIGMALVVMLGNMRSSIVEQGNALPMDVLFLPGGTADIVAQHMAQEAGIPEDQIPAIAAGAVVVAEEMLMETDQLTSQAAQEAPQGQEAMAGGGVPAGPPGGPTAPPSGIMGDMQGGMA
jgi:hypothetical protein